AEYNDQMGIPTGQEMFNDLTRRYISNHAGGIKMFNGVATLIFVLLFLAGSVISAVAYAASGSSTVSTIIVIASFFLAWIISSAARIAAQWEKGLVFRLGKFNGLRGPGLFLIIPIIDSVTIIDTRIQTLDIPKQQVITKDNVPVSINAVLYVKVVSPDDAIIKVQDYTYAVSNYAQATLRDVVGGMTLDELLAERQKIGDEIEKIVLAESKNWGLEITNIKIQDIDMPEELKKMMSRQASAEREKRATITKAEGDKMAALNLSDAARTMTASPGAMQLRTLQTIDGLGPTASNTVVLAVPIEIMEAIRAFTKNQNT
ncbi:MAG TPA: SPFH domain-containing protein, partial [Candidatus Sulfotelmatobacter sp.]|nr:SPFH domain-containing protein [Candidatus Sulfotelmatobacter sp.]